MTKLSRKDRYMDLRTSIDEPKQETAASPAPAKSAPAARRSSRQAAPDTKGEHRAAPSRPAASANPVLEDLLGEVTQYNLNNGDLVSSDTQMQILHDLSESGSNSSKRTRHLEKMELNEFAGGTTRNLYSSDLSTLASKKNAERTAPACMEAKRIEEEDDLDLGIFEPANSGSSKNAPSANEVELTNTQQVQLEAHLAAMQQSAAETSVFEDEQPEEEPVPVRKTGGSKKGSVFSRLMANMNSRNDEPEDEEEEAFLSDEEDVIENPAQEDSDLLDEEIILTVQTPKTYRSNAGYADYESQNPQIEEEEEVEEDVFEDEDDPRVQRARKKARRASEKAAKKAEKARAKAVKDDFDDAYDEEDITMSDDPSSTQEFDADDLSAKRSFFGGRKKSERIEKPDYEDFDEDYDEDEEDDRSYDPEDHAVSKGASIFMIVTSIILVVLIIATVYGMSMLGIFG